MRSFAVNRAPITGAPPRPLRRLTRELLGLVALKIALLSLIWWLAFTPQPKPDTSPQAIAQWLAPASPAPPEQHP
jgi:hypothetical protein